jgi:hypothetical protein
MEILKAGSYKKNRAWEHVTGNVATCELVAIISLNCHLLLTSAKQACGQDTQAVSEPTCTLFVSFMAT